MYAYTSLQTGMALLRVATPVIKLLNSYLNDRRCYVLYNGFPSHEFPPSSGILQGFALGPLLFNLFINDLIPSFPCPAHTYADDIKLCNQICTVPDSIILQDNVDKLVKWCRRYQLHVNASKCYIISCARICPCAKVGCESSKALGFVMRISKLLQDIHLITTLYYSFILSKLEYAALIWCPIYASK